MQSELKSLSKIFSEVIFRIPDYQRGYSWEEKHLKDFWNDIEQLPNGNSHYTGVLTLEPVQEKNYERWDDDLWIIRSKRYNPMYVVDGQQRLTTAIILLQSILDQIDEKELLNYTTKEDIRKKYIYESKGNGISRSYIFGYEKDNPSYEFLKQSVFGEKSVNHYLIEETIYTKNLIFAKKYFTDKLDLLDRAELEQVFTVLTQHLQFNIFYIEKDLDVFVTFETMNNRGKPLSHLELLKNRLIYLSTKFDAEPSEKEHLRKSINESWKSVYHYLGKLNSKKYSDDNFLRLHYVCYFAADLSEDFSESRNRPYSLKRFMRDERSYKDVLLEDIFTPKRLNVDEDEKKLTIEKVFDYAQSVKSTISLYYHVACPDLSDWSDVEKTIIEQLNRLSDSQIFLLCVAINSKVSAGEFREGLLRSLERFAFLTKINGYFFSDVDPLDLTIELLCEKLPADEIKKQMDEISEKFVKSQEFIDSIKNVGKDSGGGYYGWRQLKYFMFEYEQELKRLSKTSRQLLSWSADPSREFFDVDHRTIEHIYPQKATDRYWKQSFEAYSVKERNTLRNSLGNLLPVSHAKNSSLSNKSFELKKGSEQNQVGYRYGCLSEIQVAMSRDWGAKEIVRRGVFLLEFMERRWGLRIGDSSKKIQLLGLTFVLEREKANIASITNVAVVIPVPPEEIVEDRDDAVDF